MDIRWNAEKNELLRRERGVCFEDVAELIRTGEELDIIPNPSRSNHLKTIYPSRDLNEQYGGEG